MLCDVLPGFIEPQRADRVCSNGIESSQLDISERRFTYLLNLLDRQLAGVPSSLSNSVNHVVACAAHKKVFWIHASGLITMMANVFSFRYFTILQLIGHSMGHKVLAIFLNPAISSWSKFSVPYPTTCFASFYNSRPKPGYECSSKNRPSNTVRFFANLESCHRYMIPCKG